MSFSGATSIRSQVPGRLGRVRVLGGDHDRMDLLRPTRASKPLHALGGNLRLSVRRQPPESTVERDWRHALADRLWFTGASVSDTGCHKRRIQPEIEGVVPDFLQVVPRHDRLEGRIVSGGGADGHRERSPPPVKMLPSGGSHVFSLSELSDTTFISVSDFGAK